MKQYIFIFILLACSAAAAVLLLYQGKPGRYNWFHSLAGDWMIELKNGYEIGPSTISELERYFDIIKWVPVETAGGKIQYVPKTVINKVITYAIIEDEILLETPETWIVFNSLTEEQKTYAVGELPEMFNIAKQNVKIPRPSERNKLIFLFLLSIGGLIILAKRVLIDKIKRNSTTESI